MKNLGYNLVGKDFLVKNINEFDINITRKNNIATAITAYQQNGIVDIPEEIIQQIKNDINSSL